MKLDERIGLKSPVEAASVRSLTRSRYIITYRELRGDAACLPVKYKDDSAFLCPADARAPSVGPKFELRCSLRCAERNKDAALVEEW